MSIGCALGASATDAVSDGIIGLLKNKKRARIPLYCTAVSNDYFAFCYFTAVALLFPDGGNTLLLTDTSGFSCPSFVIKNKKSSATTKTALSNYECDMAHVRLMVDSDDAVIESNCVNEKLFSISITRFDTDYGVREREKTPRAGYFAFQNRTSCSLYGRVHAETSQKTAFEAPRVPKAQGRTKIRPPAAWLRPESIRLIGRFIFCDSTIS